MYRQHEGEIEGSGAGIHILGLEFAAELLCGLHITSVLWAPVFSTTK